MTVATIQVYRFDYGNQGQRIHVGTIERKINRSRLLVPVSDACCSRALVWRRVEWINYQGRRLILETVADATAVTVRGGDGPHIITDASYADDL